MAVEFNGVLGTIGSSFSVANETIVKPVIHVGSYVASPFISAGSVLADYTVVPVGNMTLSALKTIDPMVTALAGVGGGVALVSGINEVNDPEGDHWIGFQRIGVGTAGLGYATARVAMNYFLSSSQKEIPGDSNFLYSYGFAMISLPILAIGLVKCCARRFAHVGVFG